MMFDTRGVGADECIPTPSQMVRLLNSLSKRRGGIGQGNHDSDILGFLSLILRGGKVALENAGQTSPRNSLPMAWTWTPVVGDQNASDATQLEIVR